LIASASRVRSEWRLGDGAEIPRQLPF
jgi:hypothetical protein